MVPTEVPQVPSWKGRHKALTKLAVLPYIAHGAGASIAPAEVLAGSPILAGTKKARGGHWKKSRAKNETRASPLPLPAGHKKELQGKGLKASTELLTGPSSPRYWHALLKPTDLAVPAGVPWGAVTLVLADVVETGASILAGPRRTGVWLTWGHKAGVSLVGQLPPVLPVGAGAVPISQCLPVKR